MKAPWVLMPQWRHQAWSYSYFWGIKFMRTSQTKHFADLGYRGSNNHTPTVYTLHFRGTKYRIAGIFRGYKFSRLDHYKGFRGFYFRGLSSSLLAHAHINMQLYLHTVSLESIILNTPTIQRYKFSRYRLNPRKPRTFIPSKYTRYTGSS